MEKLVSQGLIQVRTICLTDLCTPVRNFSSYSLGLSRLERYVALCTSDSLYLN
jgi:hypothetical protein